MVRNISIFALAAAMLVINSSSVTALPATGVNLDTERVYLTCPVQENLAVGDTETCCKSIPGAAPVYSGVSAKDTNCQIAITGLSDPRFISGAVSFLTCCLTPSNNASTEPGQEEGEAGDNDAAEARQDAPEKAPSQGQAKTAQSGEGQEATAGAQPQQEATDAQSKKNAKRDEPDTSTTDTETSNPICICNLVLEPVQSPDGTIYPNVCQAKCEGADPYTLTRVPPPN